MFLALSVAQKLALFGVAALFIAFALASSFLFPRTRPDFPGPRGVRWFVALSVALMLAMLTSMAVFAREDEEAAAGHQAGASPAETERPGHSDTEPSREEESPQGGGGQGGSGAGDPAAGQRVFNAAGCGGCHVLADAGATGNVGPSLDESKPSYELAVERVTNGKGGMPPFADQLSKEEIQNVSAYVARATGGG